MERYVPGGDYPSCYRDPDVTDAEHLTVAAYHLIEAGYGEEALAFINKVTAAFADVELNRKLKPPAKALGSVRYLPCGILKCPVNGTEVNVPAPPYSDGTEEQRGAQVKKDVASRGAQSLKDARLGWFSCRQASAALAGKLPNTAYFRPAAILKKITALCAAYDPDMPKAAAAVLADKLHDVLRKNPLSHDKWTQLREDLADVDTRWHSSDSPTMHFSYLSEQHSMIAADILSRDRQNPTGDLYGLDESRVRWQECSRAVSGDMHGLLDDRSEDVLDNIPLLKAKYELQSYVAPAGGVMKHYYASPEYYMVQRVARAFDAMQDVNDLMRCHAALCRHPDGYLHGLLLQCRMIDDGLDASMPPDLFMTAGALMAARAWSPFEGGNGQPEPGLSASAEHAFAAIVARCAPEQRMDSELLHPVPEETDDDGKEEARDGRGEAEPVPA